MSVTTNRAEQGTVSRAADLIHVTLVWRAYAAGIALAVAFVLLYAASLAVMLHSIEPVEERFDTAGQGRPVAIYADLASVDPIRNEVRVRISMSTQGGTHGERFTPLADRDVILAVSDGDAEMQMRAVAGREAPSTVVTLAVNGSVWNYPLDAYTASLGFDAFELGPRGARRPVPIRATVWEGLEGWEMTADSTSSGQGADLDVDLHLGRTSAVQTFAFTIYAIMIIVAGSGIIFVTYVARGVRRVEATLTGALCAMLFALPALRRVLPGEPPFGIIADGAVFLWSEIAVALSLVVFVVAWVQRGPDP